MKNKKFNAVVIGAGVQGLVHVRAAAESPFIDKVFVFEPNQANMAEAVSLFGEKIVPLPSLEQALSDPSIRFASISSPVQFHVPQAAACMRSGKAVLLEKPIGNTLAEAKELLAVEKETGSFLQIGFELHYSKLYLKAREWIDAGLIGDPVNIQMRYLCAESEDRDTWRSRSPGSFLIGEKLSHYLDLERFFFRAEFESVYSLSSRRVVPYLNHRDNHQIMIKFPGDRVGVLNFLSYPAETWDPDCGRELLEKQLDDGHALNYLITGDKGCIQLDLFRRRARRWDFTIGPVRLLSRVSEDYVFTKEQDHEHFHNTYGQNLRVIERIARGEGPEVSAQDALETMKLCYAAELSEDTGEIIRRDDPRL